MGPLRATPLGFQALAPTSATGLTLPIGAQQASGTACNLSGRLLTVGGTVTGTFAPFQIVQGTGIPANTYIVNAGSVANTWNLSASCTTETGETVTAYLPTYPDMALIRSVTATVFWRDDGTAPTSSVGGGMPLLTTDVQPLEYTGDLLAIQFISATGTVTVSYYKYVG